VTVDTTRIPPAGDPFYAARLGSRRTDQDQGHQLRSRDCFACYEGVVYLGFSEASDVAEETGEEEYEVYTAVRCRRCVAPGDGR
jgi:hypothetical protein